MSRNLKVFGVIALLIGLAAAGCASAPEESAKSAAASEEDSRPARTLPLPTEGDSMPPGHPPTGQTGALVWAPPASWNEETPSSGMRYAQYSVDGPGGVAECVVFYFGPNQIQLPFGDGWRCVGGTVIRLGVVNSGAGGTFTRSLDYTNLPGPSNATIESGDAWNFQCWYRDPGYTPAPSNFTDAVSVVFQ